ncbi:glycosyltransferase family 4 protein [Sphingomonas endophytica]|uniref:Glycosyltransferase subfamily 4-like N-terminal domain-containing protein n=1 Tax=Sphingomonas endophytica TaxID=869719 RepID=A0A147I0Z5_9SPHN|nr:glycosyltransferase family 4 protein [Sphingomonas endophytica]KTT71179.1 hypothetical protein NS334_10850 [Sphingomonas endophytica]
MTDGAPASPRILVLPHVPVIGGAGLYNRAAIAALARRAAVTLAGDAAEAYGDIAASTAVADFVLPPRPVLPAYAGASRRAFLYHAFCAPIRATASFRWARRHAGVLAEYDAIVVTSSIDLPFLAAIAAAGIRARRVCIVQENAFLSGARGTTQRRLLRSVDTVVSISRSWSARAAMQGIASIVAANPFDVAAALPSDDTLAGYDFVFLGGSARIKGIALFLALIERLSTARPVRAMLVGAVDASWQARIEATRAMLTARGSSLSVAGFVADVAPFLRDARLLLLPITDPHFCRPAIEAGLCGRTFVVSDLPGLEDFADPGTNCLMAPPGDVAAWLAVCTRLLDGRDERTRLAAANHTHALTAFSAAGFDAAWRQVVDRCR